MERVIWVLTGLLFVVVIVSLIAGVLDPEFRTGGVAFIAALIGPLVTVVGGLGGALMAKGMKEAVAKESTLEATAADMPKKRGTRKK